MWNCKYILFSHVPNNADAWRVLRDRVPDLVRVLTSETNPGMLVLFNECGWLSLLNTVGADFDPMRLADEFAKIRDDREELREILTPYTNLSNRVRLVTAADLFQIVNNLRGNKPGNEATRLRRFLVSDELGISYDTTKVVEALVRVRHLGSGVPVLRIDWDALLSPRTLKQTLESGLYALQMRCEEYADEPFIHSYMLSGGYLQPEGTSYEEWTINDYNTAYATRVFPSLIPTEEVIEFLNDKIEDADGGPRDCSLNDEILTDLGNMGLFDHGVSQTYYGIGAPDWSGIARVGAHPDHSVISGALLSVSDGAMLDLPPFSCFRQNVMWIDDHLKYLLHQALGHFRREPLDVDRRAFSARIRGVVVHKDRIMAGQGNLRPYTLGVYIPTLFWGAILDAWIQPLVESKPPVVDTMSSGGGPFAEALSRALRRGSITEEDREQLREELMLAAVARAKLISEMWRELKTARDGQNKSFAALWADSDQFELHKVLDPHLGFPSSEWLGWGLRKDASKDIESFQDLRSPVAKGIKVLIEDVITYIDWALEWPSFVRSVRAVRNGSLNFDTSFEESNLGR